MNKKTTLATLIAVLIALTQLIHPSAANPAAVLGISPTVIDTRNLKPIGSTFSINITVDDVEKLWGIQFMVKYNTTILSAIDYAFLDRWGFANATRLPSLINETAGFVALARAAFLGDNFGLTTTSPVAVARIDFTVDANGTSPLDLELKDEDLDFFGALTNIKAAPFQNILLSDGQFSNTQLLGVHDVAVTNLSISATEASPGDIINIQAVIVNKGDFNETLDVRCDFNDTNLIETKRNIVLNKGTNQTVNFAWNTANIQYGKYVIAVRAVLSDSAPGDNMQTAAITLKSAIGSGGLPTIYLYVGVAIVVVIIVAIVIYALLRRRGK